jgi:hypothetical protein
VETAGIVEGRQIKPQREQFGFGCSVPATRPGNRHLRDRGYTSRSKTAAVEGSAETWTKLVTYMSLTLRSRPTLRSLAVTATIAVVVTVGAAGPAIAAAPPPPTAPVPAQGTGELMGIQTELGSDSSGMPPGVVNGPCTPSPEHPYPVVLVHGTFANENFSWQTLAPMLSDGGYCVFGLNYGATQWTTYSNDHIYGVDYVERSARELASFINGTALPDTFESAGNVAGYSTGAHPTEVDIVGHSQGGMMPRYMIDSTGSALYPGLGDAALVHTMIGLAPSNHGTTASGLVTLGQVIGGVDGNPGAEYSFASGYGCGACGEQEAGSPFITALNSRPDATGVDYYVIESDHDEVVTPYTSAFLPGTENIQNVTLQDQCPTDLTEHVGIIYDPVALQDVTAALANNSGTAVPLPKPICPPAVAPVISG